MGCPSWAAIVHANVHTCQCQSYPPPPTPSTHVSIVAQIRLLFFPAPLLLFWASGTSFGSLNKATANVHKHTNTRVFMYVCIYKRKQSEDEGLVWKTPCKKYEANYLQTKVREGEVIYFIDRHKTIWLPLNDSSRSSSLSSNSSFYSPPHLLHYHFHFHPNICHLCVCAHILLRFALFGLVWFASIL